MRRFFLIAGILGALLFCWSMAAEAQEVPPRPQPVTPVMCSYVDPYDHNGDQIVDWQDYEMWVAAVHQGLPTCQLDGPSAGCPDWVDINRDGLVSAADLKAMDRYRYWCFRMNSFRRWSW